jgi:hypothetical protein
LDYDNELRGMLSEAEIERMGLGLARTILFGDCGGFEGDQDRIDDASQTALPIVSLIASLRAIDAARLKVAARLVAGLTDKSAVRAKLTHRLMREETDAAIESYMRRERIPRALPLRNPA